MCMNCGEGKCGGCAGKKCLPAKIAKILLLIGGLNWGLVGIGAFLGKNWNIVNQILGGVPRIEWIVYILVGISAIVAVIGCKCKSCTVAGGDMSGMKM